MLVFHFELVGWFFAYVISYVQDLKAAIFKE